MRKIREVLRLKYAAGLSDRQIAAAVGSARSTVQECLRRCRVAGIDCGGNWFRCHKVDRMQTEAFG
jgi:transposase